MGNTEVTDAWQPVTQAERHAAMDTLRGLALFGVVLVNLHVNFRVTLAESILAPHTDAGWADRATDVMISGLLEFKAAVVFSLLFGVGLAVFTERSTARGANSTRSLARRLLVLFALGLCHLLLIWNGDILAFYAVCGFLILPLLRLPAVAQATAGTVAVVLSFFLPWGLWPTDDTLHGLATEATRVYTDGSFGDVLAFHWRETRLLILPLLVISLPKTWGLMAIGAAAWHAGVFRDPSGHRRLLWAVAVLGGVIGGTATALSVYSAFTGRPPGIPPVLLEVGSHVPLALGYAASLVLAIQSSAATRAAAPFAAAGQMALTNYLAQSVVLSLLFYGYGLGLFGRLGAAAAAGVGLTLYVGQLALSLAWLRRYRFGPVEWLWRSLTYGRRQPMRRAEVP